MQSLHIAVRQIRLLRVIQLNRTLNCTELIDLGTELIELLKIGEPSQTELHELSGQTDDKGTEINN